MKIYQIKTFHINNSSQNHFQTAQIIQEINHFITLPTEVDHQIKEIHAISHKTDIVDQIVETFNIEILIHDQTQTEQFFRLIPIPIRILRLDNIRMIDQEIHHTIDKEVIPTIETEAIRIIEINDITIDHEKSKVPCSSTNHIYQSIPKEPPKGKTWTILFLLEKPKSKEFQRPDLEIDFLIVWSRIEY